MTGLSEPDERAGPDVSRVYCVCIEVGQVPNNVNHRGVIVGKSSVQPDGGGDS